MKKIIFALLLIPTLAEAQVHSCDKPVLSGNIIISNPIFLFAACAPATVDADGIVIELNGTKTFVTVSASGPANSSGKLAYNVSVTVPSTGNHTIRTAAFTLTSTGVRQEGPLSNPFVLVLEKPAPTVQTTNHLR